mmetsp:Transcript_66607/g.174609  ORF Transcript_66607/g.174609 Transcript_66607/m.174609 type:complete len:223 (+) Transcript_66607:334-1002(+)
MSSSAYLRAPPLVSMTFSTNPRSIRRLLAAYSSARLFRLTASRMKSGSASSSDLTCSSARAFCLVAASATSRSPRSASEACCRVRPQKLTAARTTSRSARRVSGRAANACLLCRTAAQANGLSAKSSVGTNLKAWRLCRVAARAKLRRCQSSSARCARTCAGVLHCLRAARAKSPSRRNSLSAYSSARTLCLAAASTTLWFLRTIAGACPSESASPCTRASH